MIEGVDNNATFIVTANRSPNSMVTVGYSFNRNFVSGSSHRSGSDTVSLDFRGDIVDRNSGARGTPKTVVSFPLALNPGSETISNFVNGEFMVTLVVDTNSPIRYCGGRCAE